MNSDCEVICFDPALEEARNSICLEKGGPIPWLDTNRLMYSRAVRFVDHEYSLRKPWKRNES